MTNEQLIVKLSGALMKVRDWRNDVPGTGEISLGGYMPEELWHVLHTAAETILSNKLMDPQFFTFVSDQLEGQAAREQADTLALEVSALKERVTVLSNMMELVQQTNCKPHYDRLESRLATLEHLEQRSADVMREIAREVFRAEDGNGRDEDEKLILEIADALMHLDGRTVRDDAKVRVSGTFPEPLWDAVFDAAEDIKAQATKPESDALKVKLEKLESRLATLEHLEQRSADVTREIAQEVVTDYLKDEDSWKDYLHDLVSKCVDDLDLDSYVNTYLKDKGYVTDKQFLDLMSRVTDLENSDGFERNVETAMVAVMEEAYKVPEDYTALHRTFHALLKYHFGKLAREVKP